MMIPFDYLFTAMLATLLWIVGMAVIDARHAHHVHEVHRQQVAAQLRRVGATHRAP